MPNSADNKCVHTLGVPLHPPSNLDARVRIVILSGILFLSGIGALIFETLWLRLSGLAFGNSVWAAALIFSSFMAGPALGNTRAASVGNLGWRSLQFYAFVVCTGRLFRCVAGIVCDVVW